MTLQHDAERYPMHANAWALDARNKHFPLPAVTEIKLFVDPADALFAGEGHNAISPASHPDAG
ncbi:hypothetical protein V476_08665 [Pseudomonas syringae KCTC 12500]|nr:hypothetical protein V476_08665 [Pseudomonas syringae KCTC 12500]